MFVVRRHLAPTRRRVGCGGAGLRPGAQTTWTVTELLEHVAREPIDADIRRQVIGPGSVDEWLGLPPGAPTLERAVVLAGRVTGRNFVYAESAIAADRLPGPVRSRLEASRDPIGRVLLDHELALRRHQLPGPVVARHADRTGGTLLDVVVLARRYRLIVDGAPAMVISEWFLAPVGECRRRPPGHNTPSRGADRRLIRRRVRPPSPGCRSG